MKRALLILLAFVMCTAHAQTIDELNNQIKKAEEEIRLASELLNKNKNTQNKNAKDLSLVSVTIRNRKAIVANLDTQIGLVRNNVNSKSRTVSSLEDELKKLKKDYAEMMYSSYKNYKLNNYIAFLFAAKDFNDVTRRIYYIKRYALVRENKAAQIDSLAKRLSNDIIELNTRKEQLDKTVKQRNSELSKLSNEEIEYRKLNSKLKAEESKYTKNIREKRTVIANAQKRIEKMLEEERRKALASNSKLTNAEKDELIKLSGQFDQNKGKLPYPVSGGVVINKYGTYTEQGLTFNNTGINIAASKGAAVKAVFDGEVMMIGLIPGLNNAVLVRHGSYITVYANLESVSVKKGEKVSTNQVIGKMPSGDNNENWFLHFEVRKEAVSMNPESWLRR